MLIDDPNRKLLLRNTKIFAAIPEPLLDPIVEALEVVSLPAGQVLFRKGDSGEAMYIVIAGRVRVHDRELIIRTAGPGDVFGEMAALDPDLRSATITAEVDTTLFRLNQEAVYELLAHEIEAVRAVIHELSQYVRNSTADWAEDFRHRVSLEHEMEIGRRIQSGFLPNSIPQLPGWEVAASFQAARQVAGDFYDFFFLAPGNQLGLVVGDVCSKGVGAALFMTLFRSLIRATATGGDFLNWATSPAPDQLPEGQANLVEVEKILRNSLALTNNYVARNHGRASMFATIFFAILDPVTGLLTYANAGHEAPVLFNDRGIRASLEPASPVVGLFPGVDYEVNHVFMAPGDSLLVFTDGVTEAKDQQGGFYTIERLQHLLPSKPSMPAGRLLEWVENDVLSHMDGAEQFDDITMLALRRLTGK